MIGDTEAVTFSLFSSEVPWIPARLSVVAGPVRRNIDSKLLSINDTVDPVSHNAIVSMDLDSTLKLIGISWRMPVKLRDLAKDDVCCSSEDFVLDSFDSLDGSV